MNSNLKLLPAALLVAVLALAGCGGSSSDSTPTGPTPEEEANQRADDAEQRADQAEADLEAERKARAEAEAAAAAEAAQKAAATLRNALSKALTAADDATSPVAYHQTTAPSGAALRLEDAHDSFTVAVMGMPFNKEYTAYINNGRVTLAATPADGVSLGFSNAKAPAFSTSGTKVHSVNTAVGTTGATFVTAGSYHGVSGTFTCTPTDTATPCSSTIDQTDALQLVGTWTFAPGNPAARVTDGQAVQYGWWHDDLGKTTEEVRVFYAGKDAGTVVTSFAGGSLGGKATYRGNAAGLYAIHRGAGAENDSGAFTADAMLEADFGTAATISGMIDGFMGADGEPRDWSVALVSQSIDDTAGTFAATTGALAPDDSGKTIWTMGGEKGAASGGWFGAFYADEAATTTTPPAVAGAFGASHGNIGSMIGSFGAGVEDN